jgi:hypothetical protein
MGGMVMGNAVNQKRHLRDWISQVTAIGNTVKQKGSVKRKDWTRSFMHYWYWISSNFHTSLVLVLGSKAGFWLVLGLISYS